MPSLPAIRLAELHPIVVHFPIALLIVSVALDFLGVFLRRAGLTTAATWLLIVGVPGALAALLTGKVSAGSVNTAAAGELLYLHKLCAVGASLTFGALLALRLMWLTPQAATWLQQWLPATQPALAGPTRALYARLPVFYPRRTPALLVAGYLALSLVGVVLLALTGYLGGAMVYDHGVGPAVP